MAGLKPMVELMTINFSLLAIDQIVNNASKLHYMSNGQINVPLVIRMAGGAGSQLGAQHSHSLEGWFAHVPGLKVVVPATPYDAKGLLMTAFDDENPVIFIEHTALYASKGEVPEEPYRVPFGQAEVYRQGRDVTIIGYSGSVHQAFRAAEKLAGEGIEAEVLNLRTLRPLDIDGIVASVKKTSREIIAEIETDKANVEIEAFESGTFRKALAGEGDTVKVGEVIAVVGDANEDISKYAAEGAQPQPSQQTKQAEQPAKLRTQQQVPSTDGGQQQAAAPEPARSQQPSAATSADGAPEAGATPTSAQPPTPAPPTEVRSPHHAAPTAARAPALGTEHVPSSGTAGGYVTASTHG